DMATHAVKNVMNACRAIGPSGHPEAGRLGREVIASRQEGSYRTTAVREVARLEGRGALEDLGRALGEQDLAESAAAEIGYLGRNSGDPDLIRMLAKIVGSSKRPEAMVRALCFIGGAPARAIVREFLPKTWAWDRVGAAWFGLCVRHQGG